MPRRAGFFATLRYREFRALWIADVQSAMGDQVARVALSVLVFTTTGSAADTAGVYALTFAPSLIGALALGHLVDQLPPRRLLVSCDVIRAAAVGVMAIPAVPLPAVVGCLVVAVAISSPFQAAEQAVVIRMVDEDHYAPASGLRGAADQVAQLAGFPVGGLVVAVIGARSALAVDAGTYALSAVILAAYLHRRSAEPAPARDVAGDGWRRAVTAVTHRPQLPMLLAYAALVGFYVTPEALAAPLTGHHHGGPRTLGVLLAAIPLGSAVGTLAYTRLPVEQRRRWVPAVAVAAGLPLALSILDPPLVVVGGLWLALGLLTGYQAQIRIEFVQIADRRRRGQAASIAAAVVLSAQGLGAVVAGVLARVWSIPGALTVMGVAAAVVAAGLAVWRRALAAGPALRVATIPAGSDASVE